MSLLTRLIGPCPFRHGQTIRSRDPQTGVLVLRCLDCQEPIATVLASQVTRNQAEGPSEVKGQPVMAAKRVTKANITPMRKRR